MFKQLIVCVKFGYPLSESRLLYVSKYFITSFQRRLLHMSKWFSPGTLVSSTSKTGRHDIAKILLKVMFNTIAHKPRLPSPYLKVFHSFSQRLHMSKSFTSFSQLFTSCFPQQRNVCFTQTGIPTNAIIYTASIHQQSVCCTAVNLTVIYYIV